MSAFTGGDRNITQGSTHSEDVLQNVIFCNKIAEYLSFNMSLIYSLSSYYFHLYASIWGVVFFLKVLECFTIKNFKVF